MKKRRKISEQKKEILKRRIGFLFLSVFVLLGLTAAYSQVSQQESSRFLVIPISQSLADLRTEFVPALNNNIEPAIVTTTDAVVTVEAGFALRVPVLMYHYIRDNVSPSDSLGVSLSVSTRNFEAQMAYLAANGYHSVTPIDLFFALQSKSGLQGKTVVLTFDDGYEDFYTNAYPILKKYQMRATVFVIVDWIGRKDYLNADQIKQMHAEGLVDIESHTLNHVDLPAISLENAQEEIFTSKTKLEALLNKKVVVFCYPYGAYNAAIAQMVAQAGYVMAFSTRYGASENDAEMYYLRRVRINGPDSLTIFGERLKPS